jgi:putative FmdB family regulatory protein
MPTYDYKCRSCDVVFERFQRITEDPISICPECSGQVRRLIVGGTGVIFKGSGFYVTDNKKSGITSSPGKIANTTDTKKETATAVKDTPEKKTENKKAESN